MTEPDCCDPADREHAGHHSPTCTDWIGFYDDREHALTVACPAPRCRRPSGSKCVTASGYAAATHRVRIVVARGGTVRPVNTGGRPSHLQADILAAALANAGVYLLCGYNLSGVDRLRRSVRAMQDKGWIRFAGSREHEDEYRITGDGRAAHHRYEQWMSTPPRPRGGPR